VVHGTPSSYSGLARRRYIPSMLTVGDKAPDFALTAGSGETVRLRDFRGKKVVLYFYPDDDTPTCTQQACAFQDGLPLLNEKDAIVLGVSADPVASHKKFARKYNLSFTLLSDEEKVVIKKFGVWKKKKLFGREYMGIIRSTFVIDAEGRIRQIFSNVRIKKHVENVVAALDQIDNTKGSK